MSLHNGGNEPNDDANILHIMRLITHREVQVGVENEVYRMEETGGPSVMIANAETIDPTSGGSPVLGESFCDCFYSESRDAVKISCICGEEDKQFEWLWDAKQHSDAAQIKDEQKEVCFHAEYSSGTAAARGNQPLDSKQHYWEIKMTTPVYGTDMMVGVGTGHVNLNLHKNAFVSFLGKDSDSWGLSYTGKLFHKGEQRKYASKFGQGSIIGIHLDTWNGTLTFYKNRQSLGIAYTGLQGKVLYPMVSSTAARSAMKVVRSKSFKTSLQYLCCKKLRTLIPADISVLDAIPLPPGMKNYLELNLSWLLVPFLKTHKGNNNEENLRKRRLSELDDSDDGVSPKVVRIV